MSCIDGNSSLGARWANCQAALESPAVLEAIVLLDGGGVDQMHGKDRRQRVIK